MKSFKKLLIIFMLFAMIFSVISCGNTSEECEHTDENEDGICDKCDEELEDEGEEKPEGTVLIEDSEPCFRFVTYTGAKTIITEKLRTIIEAYAELGMEIEVIRESDTSEYDGIEILVGPVSNRGEEYFVDNIDVALTKAEQQI